MLGECVTAPMVPCTQALLTVLWRMQHDHPTTLMQALHMGMGCQHAECIRQATSGALHTSPSHSAVAYAA